MAFDAFISRRVVLEDGVRPACVMVDAGTGRIVEIRDAEDAPVGATLHDFGDDALLPGVVDAHVHLNEPGRTFWEGFETGTRAAAAGGVTTVVDMPLNCLPETTKVAALEAKRAAAAGKCRVDWLPWGGAVNGNSGDLAGLADSGVPGYKCFLIDPGCEGFGLIDEAELRLAMPAIAKTGLPLLVHAELAGPCDSAAAALSEADWYRYATYLASRPPEAELQAIAMMIRLAREFDCRVHIVHLSAAEALPMLREARAEGLKLTVETCPHYLYFAAETIADGSTLLKCAPPIRLEANRRALWGGLRDGTIDLIASDHSPCPPEMKGLAAGSFREAWGGIASLSLELPVVWTKAVENGFGLDDVARWMSARPAALAGVSARKGRLAAGMDADLVVFSPEGRFTASDHDLYFRHRVSPYVGERLRGVVSKTYVRGQLVFAHGDFPGEPIGREVLR
jgi:allantoinase